MKKQFIIIVFSIAILILLLNLFIGRGSVKFITSKSIISNTPPIEEVNDIILVEKPSNSKEFKDIIDSLEESKQKIDQSEKIRIKEIYLKVKSFAKKAGMEDLKTVKFDKDEKEVRIWIVEPNTVLKGFVCSYRHGKWSAIDVYKLFEGEDFQTRNLGDPYSGWFKWEEFLNEEIYPAKISKEKNSKFSFGSGLVVIESKFTDDYAKNFFFQSTLSKEPIYKIYEKIKKEFYSKKVKWGKF